MKIALIPQMLLKDTTVTSSKGSWKPFASPFINGLEIHVNDLVLGLAGRGHQITLFSPPDSRLTPNTAADQEALTRVRFIELNSLLTEKSLVKMMIQAGGAARVLSTCQSELYLQALLQAQDGFDLVHAHCHHPALYAAAAISPTPVLHTVHFPSSEPYLATLMHTAQTTRCQFATVSNACAETYAPDFEFDRVIYNGIRLDTLIFSPEAEDFLLFAGRVSPEKGPDLAIQIAKQAKKRLILVGGIARDYYDSLIAPALKDGADIVHLGLLPRSELYGLMRRASALLFPSRWVEPFGLVITEALAAGTPVIGWRQGSSLEIIEEGRTGYLLPFGDIEGAAQAVTKLDRLDRLECRRQVEARFSFEAMLDNWENFYSEVTHY